ncbi:MAG TPA: M13-type metalloendopeptidase [Pseudonocardia sp.]|jgi:putative endopeptidase|nr:M13-type metalloendopeptidase [Pseudonocardia sp.]
MNTRSGLDLQWVDTQARPQDDLYAHVNGEWLRSATIPDDRTQIGALHELRDEVEADVRDILDELRENYDDPVSNADEDCRRIRDLYCSFLDEDAIERAGTEALRALLQEISAATDRAELAAVLGARQGEGLIGLFGVIVDSDARDSSRYLVHLSQAGLGLPDASYYSDEGYSDEGYSDERAQYRDHLARLAESAGVADPGAVADSVVELEDGLAAAWSDQVSSRDVERTYNLMTWNELRERAVGFDWSAWLRGLGATEPLFAQVVVAQPDFLAAMAQLWKRLPLDQWKNWLSLQLVSASAPYLNRDLAEAHFDFYGRTLSGALEPPPRWQRATTLVEAILGDALGRLYVARYFSDSARNDVLVITQNLLEAFRHSLSRLDWMGPRTRKRALKKLNRLTVKIGYPDQWKDYSGLELSADDLFDNVRRGGRWHLDAQLSKIGHPVDRDEWLTTPQTVNAFYNPRRNEVVFPAAVLRRPLFDPSVDDAANYGGIGATIGHEIGHAFDDQGARYDGSGSLVDWWEPEDREQFRRRADALINQYDRLHPAGLPEHTVNGGLTVGENIGDLGGLAIAISAYRLALSRNGSHETCLLDNLTGLQRVFFAWARTWRAVTRETEAIRRLATDPHAPPDLRCNAVVRNLDTFHESFHVTEPDNLHTPEHERVRIW